MTPREEALLIPLDPVALELHIDILPPLGGEDEGSTPGDVLAELDCRLTFDFLIGRYWFTIFMRFSSML